MNIVDISTSKSYQVIIGNNLLGNIATYIQKVISPAKALIISDNNVAPLYAQQIINSLNSASINTTQIRLPAGESSKSLDNFTHLLFTLSNEQFSRSDAVIALGGGVVGDLSGFTAACYMRGIPYIQIPTTLLAMVDASVGGKTAINLPTDKNLVGAFYQPDLVICDTDVLNTLDEKHFRQGCAEIVKYGILYDKDLLITLLRVGIHFDRQSIITRCVELKRDVVVKDEYDRSARQMLNLGHTVGHAIEQLSNFKISHGNAVAIGISVVTRAAVSLGLCAADTLSTIENTLIKLELPTKTDLSIQEIAGAILSDKKRSGNTINLIVPQAVGACSITPMETHNLETFLKAGM